MSARRRPGFQLKLRFVASEWVKAERFEPMIDIVTQLSVRVDLSALACVRSKDKRKTIVSFTGVENAARIAARFAGSIPAATGSRIIMWM